MLFSFSEKVISISYHIRWWWDSNLPSFYSAFLSYVLKYEIFYTLCYIYKFGSYESSLEYAWLISVFVSSLLWKWLCLWCISKNILVLNYSHVKLAIYEFGMAIQFLPTLTNIKLDYTSYWIGFCWSFCKVFLFNKNSDLGYRSY